MAISQKLLRKLQETLGTEAADDLVSRLEESDSIRGDIAELRHEMRLGFARVDARFEQMERRFAAIDAQFGQVDARFAQVDARFAQVDARFTSSDEVWTARFDKGQARMEALVERSLREQTRFFFLAWSVLLAAIVGLYAR